MSLKLIDSFMTVTYEPPKIINGIRVDETTYLDRRDSPPPRQTVYHINRYKSFISSPGECEIEARLATNSQTVKGYMFKHKEFKDIFRTTDQLYVSGSRKPFPLGKG